jgi:hypothetical protein
MSDQPTTKAKQRVHVVKLIKLMDNEIVAYCTPGMRLVRQGLLDLYAQMFNRRTPPGRPVSDAVTPAKVIEVWSLREANPEWSQQEVAYYTNLNIGRVSEILHGKRD